MNHNATDCYYCVACSREIVPLSSIEHVQKKRRHDKDARLATVMVSCQSMAFYLLVITSSPVGVLHIVMSMSVCLSVCLFAYPLTSQKLHG